MSTLQRTDEWRTVRLGKCTASRLGDALAKTKSGWGAGRARYRAELVAERLTGIPYPSYQSVAMLRGIEMEGMAIVAYQLERGVDVVPVGFVQHPRLAMSGASPDGLVGNDGLVEVKCPDTSTHIQTLRGNGASIDGGYLLQMAFQMACTGRQWCDWVSFDNRLPPSMELKIIRVNRDDKAIAELERQVEEFLDEVAEEEAYLRQTYP